MDSFDLKAMQQLSTRDVSSLRGVLAFTVMAHVLDLITTQYRDPMLAFEGNPFYQLVEHLGHGGWHWLVIIKVVTVGAFGLAYWWYLANRHNYLPDRVVHSPRALIWFGMWDRKPYPKSLWRRIFNRRKLSFLGLVLAGIALPGGGAAALFISLDNVLVRMGHSLPSHIVASFIMLTTLLVFIWWYFAYWAYYREQERAGQIPNNPSVE